MQDIKTFVFNPFQVNTYLLSDDSGECIIVDAACATDEETGRLTDYIKEHKLTPVMLVNTHAHVDHLPGVTRLREAFKIPFLMHKDDTFLLNRAVEQGQIFGFEMVQPGDPDRYIEEGDTITFGATILEILHVPGHSPGSVVLKNTHQQFLVTGDVLFAGSIGRTDLPGGDYETLTGGIKNKLLTLNDEYVVYPGHGPSTTIGQEREHNPFLR
ncbi:MAG TPA: MBL fold metallo-hydrolase [Bacteroidales bacterium]|nr:MBL fold metallo-hydrolase [Bacteroidales bacterium]